MVRHPLPLCLHRPVHPGGPLSGRAGVVFAVVVVVVAAAARRMLWPARLMPWEDFVPDKSLPFVLGIDKTGGTGVGGAPG